MDSSDLETITTFSDRGESTMSPTFETFSLETDKLMSDIDMVNSPSEFFYFNDNFDKTMDASEIRDALRSSDDCGFGDLVKELMDDFGRYFSDDDKMDQDSKKLKKKYCKYDDDFKSKVIGYLSEHRIAEAASRFDVHPSTVSIWLKNDQFLKNITEVCSIHRRCSQF